MAELSQQMIAAFIHAKIAPSLVAHGGGVEIVSFENRILTLRMYGACVACHAQIFTAESIRDYILNHFPELEDVVIQE